ncbi:Phthiotriol/phenolphthiotriol dimycocerosates methyltransferase [Roseibaca ekhonensis]|jgi:SAM-dependent methyltransferase|uniref:Phthiotriol/phenolphthiotriol dimycocerosates methyltransferase n=1 Tax=Roseinatronobacter ekhonensis TaxID=254356 RepID=A0A3B0MP77_9RHOB|nr:class I SAM-dependent methyltransferase [Roseibaca ekhonensis]SUZ31429.1 Phthiotriol/phenolphthiotriol dimycocerosates methyltransferase [Roseibaca ekhonensis]
MQSYSRGIRSLRGLLVELIGLYRRQTRDIPLQVSQALEIQRDTVAAIEELRGAPLMDCDILEIGPGQTRLFLMATGLTNRAIGVDMERTPDRLGPAALWRIWRQNGSLRLVKTLGRSVMGIDRRTRAELARQLGVRPAQLHNRIVQGDAQALPFEDSSFDAVVSTSVFEHLEHPDQAAAEVARVLRPGGVARMITHLYTSHTGAHDTRLFLDPHALPPWPHLRAGTRDMVQSNSYLNEWRLADYRRAFKDQWPGHSDWLGIEDYPAQSDLDRLRAAGELEGFVDDELRASVLITSWRKPGG